MNALYNEIEPFACNWLEELERRGHIASGRVERRSISDLTAADVAGPGQRHFFAGIGVWSAALRDAGVPDDADVWTGSCPCQPFSAAGSRSGTSDPRHLWPAWFALIEQCRPPIIFGEQVASKDGLKWLDLVFADLERCDYAVGAADLCAAGVGAPHIRQRLYFVAYANDRDVGEWLQLSQRQPRREMPDPHGRSAPVDVADSNGSRREGAESKSRRRRRSADSGPPVELGHASRDRTRKHARELPSDEAQREVRPSDGNHASVAAGATSGFWSGADWIHCADGVSRPVEPGTFPLAHGAPARVGRLRGYGNAIVRPKAATFIRAALDAIGGLK